MLKPIYTSHANYCISIFDIHSDFFFLISSIISAHPTPTPSFPSHTPLLLQPSLNFLFILNVKRLVAPLDKAII